MESHRHLGLLLSVKVIGKVDACLSYHTALAVREREVLPMSQPSSALPFIGGSSILLNDLGIIDWYFIGDNNKNLHESVDVDSHKVI